MAEPPGPSQPGAWVLATCPLPAAALLWCPGQPSSLSPGLTASVVRS